MPPKETSSFYTCIEANYKQLCDRGFSLWYTYCSALYVVYNNNSMTYCIKFSSFVNYRDSFHYQDIFRVTIMIDYCWDYCLLRLICNADILPPLHSTWLPYLRLIPQALAISSCLSLMQISVYSTFSKKSQFITYLVIKTWTVLCAFWNKTCTAWTFSRYIQWCLPRWQRHLQHTVRGKILEGEKNGELWTIRQFFSPIISVLEIQESIS